MIARERRVTGGSVGREFEKELDNILDENSELRLENRRLKKVNSGLRAKLAAANRRANTRKSAVGYRTGQPGYMRATHQSKNFSTRNKDILAETGGDYEMAYFQMKEQLNNIQARANILEEENQKLRGEIDHDKKEIHNMNSKVHDMERDNSYVILQQKHDELLDELKRARIDKKTIENQLIMAQAEGGAQRADTARMQELINERNMLQSQLDDMMSLPFFKKEAGKSTYQENQSLRIKMKDKESEIKKQLDRAQKVDSELAKLKDELKMVTAERDQLKNMNSSFKNRMMEGSDYNMQNMMHQLMNVDPNEFRKTMEDLNYTGLEPLWSKIDFAESAGMVAPVDENDPKSLMREIERLKADK